MMMLIVILIFSVTNSYVKVTIITQDKIILLILEIFTKIVTIIEIIMKTFTKNNDVIEL